MSAFTVHRAPARLAVAVLAATVLSGCAQVEDLYKDLHGRITGKSAQDAGRAAGATPPVCSLLTDQESTSLVGKQYGKPEQTATSCLWRGAGGSLQVEVSPLTYTRDQFLRRVTTTGGELVAGYGDAAGKTTGGFLVLKGRTMVTISAFRVADQQQAQREAAKRVLTRL